MTYNSRNRFLPLFALLPALLFAGLAATANNPRSSLLLLIDTSGSMDSPVGGGNSEIKIEAAKSAALAAVQQASRRRDVEVAVLAFEGDCSQPISRYHGFTTDFNSLAAFIQSLQAGGGTPMAEAVIFANRFMQREGAPSAQDQMIVLLADGANDCGSVTAALNELKASGVIFRHETVGFGIEPNSQAAQDLQAVATASGGSYHHAQDAVQLSNVFMEFVNTSNLIDLLGTFGRNAGVAAGRQQDATAPVGQVGARQPTATPSAGAPGSGMQAGRQPPQVPGHAQQVLEWNGVELHTAVQRITPAASRCVVDWVAGYTKDEYEQWKARNHGQPLDVWQLDMSVYNGSGRWLLQGTVNYSYATERLPCTSFSPSPAEHATWGGGISIIQWLGQGRLAPGETLTRTDYVIIYHDQKPPWFDSWKLYNVVFGDSLSVAAAADLHSNPSRPRR